MKLSIWSVVVIFNNTQKKHRKIEKMNKSRLRRFALVKSKKNGKQL